MGEMVDIPVFNQLETSTLSSITIPSTHTYSNLKYKMPSSRSYAKVKIANDLWFAFSTCPETRLSTQKVFLWKYSFIRSLPIQLLVRLKETPGLTMQGHSIAISRV